MRIRTPKCTDKKENKRRKRSKRNSTYRDIYRNTYRGEKTLFLSLFRGTPIYLSLRVANSECEIAAQRRNFDEQGFRFFLSLSLPLLLSIFFSFSRPSQFPQRSFTGAFLPANPLSPPNENSLARTSFTNYVSSASNSSNRAAATVAAAALRRYLLTKH